jgi:hypothetical protein
MKSLIVSLKPLILVLGIFFAICWLAILAEHYLMPKKLHLCNPALAFEMEVRTPEWDRAEQRAHEREVEKARERVNDGTASDDDRGVVMRDFMDNAV